MRDSILLSMASGEAVLRDLSWMSEFQPSGSLEHKFNNLQLAAIGKMNLRKSMHTYEQRLLEVEHSSFTPLVLSATGGMARQATSGLLRISCLPTSGTIRTAQLYVGYVVAWPSHYFDLPYSASMDPKPALP